MRPAKYCIYKGLKGTQGALQFSLKPAEDKLDLENSFKEVEAGCLFLEAATAIGENLYDWDHKIIFAFNINDIGKFLDGLNKESFKIFHDPGAGGPMKGKKSKILAVQRGAQIAGSYFLNLTEKSGDEEKKVSVSINADEMIILENLMVRAISKILGW